MYIYEVRTLMSGMLFLNFLSLHNTEEIRRRSVEWDGGRKGQTNKAKTIHRSQVRICLEMSLGFAKLSLDYKQ